MDLVEADDDSVGTPSTSGVSASSETMFRLMRVNAGNDHGTDPICDRVPGEDHYGPVATGCGSEPDVTPLHRPNPPDSRPDPIRDLGQCRLV